MTRISILVLPEAVPSAFTSVWDVLISVADIATVFNIKTPRNEIFDLEYVSASLKPLQWSNGLMIHPHRSIDQVKRTDVIYIPTIDVKDRDKHDDVSAWIRDMFQKGTLLCGACTGAFILADTGLLDKQQATTHWVYASQFKDEFPLVNVQDRRIFITSGKNAQLVTTGGSYGAWQNLMLYLTARFFGRELAAQVGKVYLIDWHENDQALYTNFTTDPNHNDAAIHASQRWISEHYPEKNILDVALAKSALPSRTFIRRFKSATGFTPIAYLQKIRIEAAKKQLEECTRSIDVIGVDVGYSDPSYFRQLFKRETGVTPSKYRKKFQIVW